MNKNIQVKKLIESGIGFAKTAKKLNLSYSTVWRLAKEQNIKSPNPSHGLPKHTLDIKFFETIDNEEKAYFLGYILADGCVFQDTRCKTTKLSMRLVSVDMDILEKFKKTVNYSGKIYHHWKNGWAVAISRNDFVIPLIKLGIVPRKTKTVKYPKIPKELEKHFLRGVIDADGWISKNEKKVRIYTASLAFAKELNKKYGFPFKWAENVYILYASKKHKKFIVEAYDNANIYLDRKYKRYIENWT